jgi:chemotaxis protein CheD
MQVAVGVGDCRVSNDPQCVLVTYALGSCIALMIHDREAGVGGLLHFMLPDSRLDRGRARESPFRFADTGIPLLFRSAYELGADKRRMSIAVAGGAEMMDQGGRFSIGKRNHLALRRILWEAGVMVDAEEVGGLASRTVRLEVGSGKVLLRVGGEPEQELSTSGAPWKEFLTGALRPDRG